MFERVLIEALIVADKFLRWITCDEWHITVYGEEVINYDR